MVSDTLESFVFKPGILYPSRSHTEYTLTSAWERQQDASILLRPLEIGKHRLRGH